MASQQPFPLMPAKSTELRLLHFDDYAYSGTSDTLLYKYVDALCGTTGAGALVNEIFLARLGAALSTIYFNELDFIFGKISFLSRSPAESYDYNPSIDQLTTDQWDEVRVKDSWYRTSITEFFKACQLGGTPDGIRQTVQAALGVDCDIYEVWRYKDNFGITSDLGRSPQTARNEAVIRPHKTAIAPAEMRRLRDMLEKIMPVDAILTINPQGLAVMAPVSMSSVAADSTYFEVQKMVTATPALDQLPPPDLLPIDLLPSEQWLYDAKNSPVLAPYAAFNISAEFGYYYLVGGGKASPIDSVTYTTLNPDGSFAAAPNFQVFDTTGEFGPKTPYEKADSPDNFPGGKFGIHPDTAPAMHPDGTAYIFGWDSQQDFIASKVLEVLAMGGEADIEGFRLPIQAPSNSARTFYPDYAVAYSPPSKDSDVSVALTRRRGSSFNFNPELRDPVNFVRSN